VAVLVVAAVEGAERAISCTTRPAASGVRERPPIQVQRPGVSRFQYFRRPARTR
jgi:hypothetical protein